MHKWIDIKPALGSKSENFVHQKERKQFKQLYYSSESATPEKPWREKKRNSKIRNSSIIIKVRYKRQAKLCN